MAFSHATKGGGQYFYSAFATSTGKARQLLSKMQKTNKVKQILNMCQEESNKLLAAIDESGKDDPSIAEIMSSLLTKFIDIAVKDSGYTGNSEELLLNYVHPLFLKARTEASKGDNLDWIMQSDWTLPMNSRRQH